MYKKAAISGLFLLSGKLKNARQRISARNPLFCWQAKERAIDTMKMYIYTRKEILFLWKNFADSFSGYFILRTD